MLDTKADEITLPAGALGDQAATVFADGTAYKGAPDNGSARKGEIRAMIGVSASGESFPLGVWIRGESWAKIAGEIQAHAMRFPAGTTLVADAEAGLADALAGQMELHQRCHWHVVRDLYHAMWKDGGRRGEMRPVQNALRAVLAVELPRGDFRAVPESQKNEIEERMEKADAQVLNLVRHLSERGFEKAAQYVERSRRHLFSYIRRWLKFGILCPRASSLIERFFRELGRRVKRSGCAWMAPSTCSSASSVLIEHHRLSDIHKNFPQCGTIGPDFSTVWNDWARFSHTVENHCELYSWIFCKGGGRVVWCWRALCWRTAECRAPCCGAARPRCLGLLARTKEGEGCALF